MELTGSIFTEHVVRDRSSVTTAQYAQECSDAERQIMEVVAVDGLVAHLIEAPSAEQQLKGPFLKRGRGGAGMRCPPSTEEQRGVPAWKHSNALLWTGSAEKEF